jgi:hypothetical protein
MIENRGYMPSKIIILFLMQMTNPCTAEANSAVGKSVERFKGFTGYHVQSLVAGGDRACAIDESGVRCWGDNSDGQTNVPNDIKDPRMLALGYGYTCVLHQGGVRCWGRDYFGETTVPQNLQNPSLIVAGAGHTCAVDDLGIHCWGRDNHGQVTHMPASLSNIIGISAGPFATCAWSDSDMECWGQNNERMLDIPAGVTNPRDIQLGSFHTCAVVDSAVKCWGWHEFDFLKAPKNLKKPKMLTVGGEHSCVIDEPNLHCWGRGLYGAMDTPSDVKDVRLAAAGDGFTCVLEDSGVRCWGYNGYRIRDVPKDIGSFSGPGALMRRNWASTLGQYTYGDKKIFLRLLQNRILDKFENLSLGSSDTQFVVMLMDEWLRAVDSDYFQRDIMPVWDIQKARLTKNTGIASLKDVLPTPQTLPLALHFIEAALVSSKNLLSAPSQQELDQVLDVIAALKERASVSEGLLQELMTHILKRKFFSEISASNRLTPMCKIFHSVIDWLKM